MKKLLIIATLSIAVAAVIKRVNFKKKNLTSVKRIEGLNIRLGL